MSFPVCNLFTPIRFWIVCPCIRLMINNWFNLPYTDVCTALYTQCFPSVWKNFTGDSGRIRTNDLLLTSADLLTSWPPSLPDDDRPARILYSSGFRDMYRLVKFLRRVINNWFNLSYTVHVHVCWTPVDKTEAGKKIWWTLLCNKNLHYIMLLMK